MSTPNPHKRRALETVRAEDYIEYFLFPAPAANTPNANTASAAADGETLDALAVEVNRLAADYGAQYIWHKDGFRVQSRHGNARLLRDADAAEDNDVEDAARRRDPLPAHLYGCTYFDDNIQDEWMVVAVLFELTRRIEGLVVRCADADGEFVLIEAAEVLPTWANPETCAEKIFITAGHLHLVNTATDPRTQPPPPTGLIDTLVALRSNPTAHRMSAAVHSAIEARLAAFADPARIAEQLHLQRCFVPLPAAAALAARPQLVAAAVRAFCQRDAVDMRSCRAMRHFPPECRVRTAVRFTRYLYAMLAHSAYAPDRRTGWQQMPAPGTPEHAEHSIGVKLACGFEILAAQAATKRVPTGRSAETSAEAEEADWSTNRQWLEYRAGLERRGYFQELLEGSQGHQRLMKSAREYFVEHVASGGEETTFAREAGTDVLRLLRELEFSEEEFRAREATLPPSDDASWLNVSAEDLDAMLAERYGIRKSVQCNGNGGSEEATSAAELTGNLDAFLNRESEYDGVQIEDDDDETTPTTSTTKGKSVQFATANGAEEAAATELANHSLNTSAAIDFNPDDFFRHAQDMLDLVIPEDDWESQSDMSDYENDAEPTGERIEQMKNGVGGRKAADEPTMQAYMDQMDAELSRTTIGKSFETKAKARAQAPQQRRPNVAEAEDDLDSDDLADDFDNVESFSPVDIDVNTLKHMAHSYRSQFGGPGPTSSLLGQLGMRVNPELSAEDDAKEYNTQV